MEKILFLHGALGAASMFEMLMNRLENNFECAAIDFPLHGQNSTPSVFSIEAFTSYLIEYIEKTYTQKIVLFGYSMGGYVALCAATQRPELFSSVITLATKFQWNTDIASKEMAMLNTDKMQLKVPDFVEQLKQKHHCIDWKQMVEATASLLERLGSHNILNEDRLKQLQVKVYVGVGDKNKMVRVEETYAVSQLIPEANFYVLPETQHAFESANLEVLVSIVRQCMRSL